MRLSRHAVVATVTALAVAGSGAVALGATNDNQQTTTQQQRSLHADPVMVNLKPQIVLLEEMKVRSAPMPREYRVAVSPDAQDLKGYEKSLYRGKYYHKDQESWRKCVMDRESNFRYTAANSRSSARGAYQFLDNNWRDGLVHMMLKESKKKDHGLEKKLKKLFDKPIHKWNRYFQDRAFFTALNYNGKWSGKKHWKATVPGTGC